VTFYRLGSLTRRNPAQAFSGEGALYAAGRWNSAGTRLVYTSTSVALACLETLVHIRALQRPEERWLFTIDIPDELVETLRPVPVGWHTEPAGLASQAAGDKWIAAQRGVALLVPSVIVPMEQNALINPRHPQFRLDWVKAPVRFRYDPRLRE
jgi:RES domain-containing protein